MTKTISLLLMLVFSNSVFAAVVPIFVPVTKPPNDKQNSTGIPVLIKNIKSKVGCGFSTLEVLDDWGPDSKKLKDFVCPQGTLATIIWEDTFFSGRCPAKIVCSK